MDILRMSIDEPFVCSNHNKLSQTSWQRNRAQFWETNWNVIKCWNYWFGCTTNSGAVTLMITRRETCSQYRLWRDTSFHINDTGSTLWDHCLPNKWQHSNCHAPGVSRSQSDNRQTAPGVSRSQSDPGSISWSDLGIFFLHFGVSDNRGYRRHIHPLCHLIPTYLPTDCWLLMISPATWKELGIWIDWDRTHNPNNLNTTWTHRPQFPAP